jgi:hypothetical protein
MTTLVDTLVPDEPWAVVAPLLKVNCPECNYSFATGEGEPWCGEPPGCRWAAEGRKHAERARRLQAQQR